MSRSLTTTLGTFAASLGIKVAVPHHIALINRQLWSPYLGILVNSGLVTLLLSEVVKYFRTFRRDKPILKATVVALTIVELTQW